MVGEGGGLWWLTVVESMRLCELDPHWESAHPTEEKGTLAAERPFRLSESSDSAVSDAAAGPKRRATTSDEPRLRPT